MELSYFLAKLFGFTLVIFALAALYRPQVVSDCMRDFKQNTFVVIFAGLVGIVIGLAMIFSHNVWETSWRGLITLFGWLAVIKGATYIAAPSVLSDLSHKLMGNKRQQQVVLIIVLAIGAYLAYKGLGY